MNTALTKRGFTLVEMIVSLGLFTIVMFIATSAFLSIVNADRKSRAVRIATDNLNIALEDMSRRIKTGSGYACNPTDTSSRDCNQEGSLWLTDQDALRINYTRAIGPAGCGALYGDMQGCIVRVGTLGRNVTTSPEIDIRTLGFVVSGSYPCGGNSPCTVSAGVSDAKQPMVTILIDGAFGTGVAASKFKIQTTVTQRQYDN